MARSPRYKRVRWRVRRCPSGWLPLVLFGEELVILPIQPSKALARDIARSYAGNLRSAGL